MASTPQTLKEQSYVELTFDPDPGLSLNFDGLRTHDELGRPFLFEVDLSTGELKGDVRKLLGANATIWLALSDPDHPGDEDRYFNGIVTRVVSHGLAAGSYRYRVEIRPWVWLLGRNNDCRIFQNKSAFEIVKQVFKDAGFSDYQDARQSSFGDVQLEYCVQYRESSLDFVTRLMETYGFYYYFKHENKKHTLMFVDDPNAHQRVTDPIPYTFDRTESRTVADHIWQWESDLGLHSGKFTHQDYNFTTPSVDLTAKTVNAGSHTHDAFEVYDYPGLHEDANVGQRLSDVRMQAIAADRAVFRSLSNSRKLLTGCRFTLSQYPDQPINGEYLITQTHLTISAAEGMSSIENEGETIDTYRVVVHAIPAATPFRLHRSTARPMIRGPQTAKVVGQSGEEITTDEYGRIKVRFHWDRSSTPDDQRSCWIRVAQSWGGASWGSIFIPRVNQEVVVEFLEGNPDRPLITGVVYNANQKVPYGLPENKTRTTLKTNSSPGGSGFNELRFEDKAGEEEIFFKSQKDYNKEVGNNETVKVKNDTTTTVESGNRSVTVSAGNDSKTVSSGNHSVDVSAGTSKITAAQSITLTVGGNSIKIDTSGVTINGIKLDLKASATMSADGGGAMTLKAGMIAIN